MLTTKWLPLNLKPIKVRKHNVYRWQYKVENKEPKSRQGAKLDNISIGMIKVCDKSIALSLGLIFQYALNDGVLPDNWK